ncbi:disease resistance protein RPV1-like [Prunus dulcis]|uniref:disease resistance protein RPV1-like n=1 Tax=Prunus dulcis TaxID=3755 RepID=UPI0014831081|nr:disease resistance protein RPV1-like [Prunus dulcis]
MCEIRENFGEALAHHEHKFKNDIGKVLRWRAALREASNFSGWSFLEGYESKFIHDIVGEISAKVLNCLHLNVAEYPVGIQDRLRDLNVLINVEKNDVRMVGIWGTGGIGKTTIAKAVHNSIVKRFEGSCFLANVRENSIRDGGMVELQNTLLFEIFRGKKLKITNVDKGINVIKKMLSHRKVLLILDDVSHLDQLKKLAGGCDWFGLGSRIIITTRDKHLLLAHQVNLIYKVKELCRDEVIQPFSWNAFGRNFHMVDHGKVKRVVLHYADGLPLALTVFGSLLRGRSEEQWQDALDNYKRVPNHEIHEILKISYNSLEDSVKEVFLDIACFFKEMGKEIVRQESPTEPGKRSRLWFPEDVYHVLTENTGTDKVKGIVVQCPKSDDIRLNATSFSKMKNLKLFINCNARLFVDVEYLPNELMFLDWPGCPLQSFPANFNPKKLFKLNMPRSHLTRPGEGLKNLQKLKSINLDHCEFLTEIADFSRIPNLEYLNLNYCTVIKELRSSVGFFTGLEELNLYDSPNLTNLPSNIYELQNLRSPLKTPTLKFYYQAVKFRSGSVAGKSGIRAGSVGIQRLNGMNYEALSSSKISGILIVSLYVDDIVYTRSSKDMMTEVKNEMMRQYEMIDLGLLHHFLGLGVLQIDTCIFLHQKKYAKTLLEKFGLKDCKSVATPLAVNEKLSKVDERSLLARFMHSPTKKHMGTAKRVLRYIQGTVNYGIAYKKGKSAVLIGYCDSDWSGSEDMRSTSSYAFNLGSGVFSWASIKQSSVALSTAEAEYISATEATAQAIWLRFVLSNFGEEQAEPTQLLCDNTSAIATSKNPVHHHKTRHINRRFHFIRDALQDGEIDLLYCKTEEQVADIFTKALARDHFEFLRKAHT